jgi:hypothetical protein
MLQHAVEPSSYLIMTMMSCRMFIRFLIINVKQAYCFAAIAFPKKDTEMHSMWAEGVLSPDSSMCVELSANRTGRVNTTYTKILTLPQF